MLKIFLVLPRLVQKAQVMILQLAIQLLPQQQLLQYVREQQCRWQVQRLDLLPLALWKYLQPTVLAEHD